MKANRRIQFLIGIAAILAIWRVSDAFSLGGTANEASWTQSNIRLRSSSKALDTKVQALDDLPRLQFKAEKETVPEMDPRARNPFSFGTDRKAEIERKRELDRARDQAALRTAAVDETQTAPEKPSPKFTGNILGLFSDPFLGQRVAIEYEDELFILREGDSFLDIFRVVAITNESVTLQHAETNIDMEIPLDRDTSTRPNTW